jgi:hypothetical protein
LTGIGATGHQDLPSSAIDYISAAIREILAGYPDIVGYTSLAAGADQLFATEVLAAGGRLHAVIPADGYAATFEGDAADAYHRLFALAAEHTRLPFAAPGEAAYDAAGRWIAEHSDVLIAVWDGQPARGLGGTADAVAHARDLEREVRIVWPSGLRRG